jgi:hypothetical protein
LVPINVSPTVVRNAPMWRNGRRNGLKIEVLQVSLLFDAHQIVSVFPAKSREIHAWMPFRTGWAERSAFLHKLLHSYPGDCFRSSSFVCSDSFALDLS